MLAAAAGGDRRAFAALYDRLAPPLFSLVLRMVGDHAAAEDVFQEIFLRIWRRLPTYDGRRSSVFTWAVTIARSKAIDHLRALGRRRQTFVSPLEGEQTGAAPDPTASGDVLAQERDAAANVRRALAGLPTEQREAIELAFFGGLSHPEIAGRLGQPLGTVKARIRRGLLRLRDELPRVGENSSSSPPP